jgi:hypothetical protein
VCGGNEKYSTTKNKLKYGRLRSTYLEERELFIEKRRARRLVKEAEEGRFRTYTDVDI